MTLSDVKTLYIHVSVLDIRPFMSFSDISETQISKCFKVKVRRPVTDRTQEVGLDCVLVWRTFWSLLLLITSLWQGSAFIHPVKFGSQWKYPSSVLLPFSGSGTCGGLGFRQNMHTHTSTPGFYLFTRSDQTVCRPFVSAVFAGMCVQQITHLVVTLQVVILTYLKQIEFSFCLKRSFVPIFVLSLRGFF